MVLCIAAGAVVMSVGLPDGVTEIHTEQDLLGLLGANESSARIRAVLSENVTLNTLFEPGDFYGTLDGCGHTVMIGNNRVEKLFNTVADGSTVINLNVKGMIGSSEAVSAAGICEYNRGTIANCCVTANFSAASQAAGICLRNAGYIRNCAVLGISLTAGDGRPVWYPITGESTGSADNCFYLCDGAAEYSAGFGMGVTVGECTDGSLAAKLESYANDHRGFTSWQSGADGFPVLLPMSAGGAASVFSNGTEMCVFLLGIVIFILLMIYSFYYFDKRKKFVKQEGTTV